MWRCDPQEIEDYAKQSSKSPSVWVVKHPPFLTTPHEEDERQSKYVLSQKILVISYVF